jgi:hypothetical protein
MTTIQRTSASAFLGLAFGRAGHDALRMPEPRVGSSICGITSLFAPRGPLFEEDKGGGGGGGGGDEKKFSQAEVDAMIQKRVAGLNEKLKAAEATAAKVAEIEAKLAEADAEREKATEAEALKGKSEVEKLQHQIKKNEELAAKAAADWQKKLSDAEGKAKAAEEKHVGHVTRSAVTEALVASGALGSAVGDAALSFLAEAQIERGEDGVSLRSITVGGKPFDKPADAAKHFLSTKPYYATPASGGAGGSKSPNGGPTKGDVSKSSADDDFSVGMSAGAGT